MQLLHRFLLACLAAALVLTAGCSVNPATGKRELALFQVSTEEEVGIGEKTFPQVLQQMGGEYPDKQLNAYLDALGQRLGRVSQRPELPYRFRVVNDSTPNAFALPGGFIAVSRGLLVGLENEAQLAAVLGHEIGHVTARHAVQGMQRGTLLNLGLAVLSGATGDAAYGPLAQQAGQLAASLVDKRYSREQERESDTLGIDYMVRSGYDPRGAVQVQEFFYRQMEGGAEPMWLAGLFRTHPFSKERMLANRDYIAARYPAAAGRTLAPEAFRAATARLRQTHAGYELYDEARRLEGSGDLAGAIATYHRALEAAPDEALILTGLGLASLKAGDHAPARRYLQQALRLDDGYYQTHLGLGYAHLQMGDAEAAVQAAERSVALLPTLPGAYLLAEGLEKSGRRQEALDLYREIASADPGGKFGQAAAGRVRALEGR